MFIESRDSLPKEGFVAVVDQIQLARNLQEGIAVQQHTDVRREFASHALGQLELAPLKCARVDVAVHARTAYIFERLHFLNKQNSVSRHENVWLSGRAVKIVFVEVNDEVSSLCLILSETRLMSEDQSQTRWPSAVPVQAIATVIPTSRPA